LGHGCALAGPLALANSQAAPASQTAGKQMEFTADAGRGGELEILTEDRMPGKGHLAACQGQAQLCPVDTTLSDDQKSQGEGSSQRHNGQADEVLNRAQTEFEEQD